MTRTPPSAIPPGRFDPKPALLGCPPRPIFIDSGQFHFAAAWVTSTGQDFATPQEACDVR